MEEMQINGGMESGQSSETKNGVTESMDDSVKIRKSFDSASRFSDNGEMMDNDGYQSEESDSLDHSMQRRFSEDLQLSIQSDDLSFNDTLKKPEAIRQSSRANRNSNPAAFLMKKPKLPTDMTNPAYKKPFKYGWKRELVYRANSEMGPKRNGDIYYFTPDGKKVRSMREVLENLKNKELSTENFTFYKEPLGMDPELEIIRTAKVKGCTTPINTFTVAKKKLPPLIGKKGGGGFKVKLSAARLSGGKKTFSPIRPEKRPKMEMMPPEWQSPSTSRKTSEKLLNNLLEKVKMTEQCSIRCKNVDPVVPTLQCSLCLCLYHPECVGMPPVSSPNFQEHYMCKNCQPVEEKDYNNKEPNRKKPNRIIRKEENKTLLGSVTTWVHPSSTVQINPETSPISDAAAQSQAIINGRKYIIIPKQNVLSIHPNEQAATAKAADPVPDRVPDTASLGPLTYNSEVITITTNNAQPTCPTRSNSPTGSFGGKSTSTDFRQEFTPSTSPARTKHPTEENSFQSDKIDKSKYINREQYMKDFFMNVSIGYNVLLHVFQYLKVQELLRVSRVSRMWHDLATHRSLWRIVRMKNSQVRDWKGLVTALRQYRTQTLDLRKMLTTDQMWDNFSSEISAVDSLTRIDFCKCPASVIEQLPETNPRLTCINAVAISCTQINLSNYSKLINLTELRLKSLSGIELINDFSFLKYLVKLKHLSILSFKSLKEIEVLINLIELESLELGECVNLTSDFGAVLSKLQHLEKLRLEKGPTSTVSHIIIESLSKLPKLTQLEFINFDVKPGFDEALSLCKNVKKLMLIPTYISQSATTNNMVLNGIFQLSDNLTHFIWGVTLELLRVTELFIDQCEKPKKDSKKVMSGGESIPILKPVPFVEEFQNSRDVVQDNTQVEILSLDNLETLLKLKLPKTYIKLLKIPYHATWRQNFSDVIQM